MCGITEPYKKINIDMTPTYQTESIIAIKNELLPLVIEHNREVNFWPETPLDIDWARYGQSELAGVYKLVTCRLDAVLIGWIGYWVGHHTRHLGMNMAREDWYYLQPTYRGRGWGRELFVTGERYLKSIEVDRIVISTKLSHDHSKILAGLGYTEYERHYTKKLES